MNISGAVFNRISPSTLLPGLLVSQTQDVPWRKFLATGEVETLGEVGDRAFYEMAMRPSTAFLRSQANFRQDIPSVNYVMSQLAADVYRTSTRCIINLDDDRAAQRNGIPHQEVMEALMMQAQEASLRQAFWSGSIGSANGGFLNQAPVQSIPTISGNSTWSTYTPADLVTLILSAIRQVQSNSQQKAVTRFIVASNRLFNLIKYTLPAPSAYASFAGQSATVGAMVNWVARQVGDKEIIFIADDYLAGNGSPGVSSTTPDYLAFISPSMKGYNGAGNAIANISKADNACIKMIRAGGVELFQNNINAKNRELLMEQNTTDGWVVRPQAQFLYSGLFY